MPENYLRVLVVDDDKRMVAVMAESLTVLGGYTVQVAHNGIEALQQLEEFHPDCCVIDVKMPGLNGVNLVQAIRGDPATVDIPLIIVSALAQDMDRFTGIAAGADQYLIKPVRPADLVRAVNKSLALTVDERNRRFIALGQQFDEELSR